MHGSWKAGGVAVLLTLVSVTLAYQLPAVIELDLGRGFPSALAVDNFHDTEQGYRWTRARSRIVFRDPGASRRARVEVELSGFRPPGLPLPLVVIEASGDITRVEPSRRIAWYGLDTSTRGWWSSDLELRLRSETFSPGAGDDRALGVRVQHARLTIPGGAAPPLRQLSSSLVLVALLFVGCRRPAWRGQASPRAGAWLAGSAGIALGVGFALARGITTWIVPALATLLVALAVARILVPSAYQLAVDVVAAATRALVDSVAVLVRRRTLALASIALASLAASYAFSPVVELDLGSGALTPIARRFGPLDREGDVTFRLARAGASVDVRDFGATRPWKIFVHASARGESARGVVLRTADKDLVADVFPEWTRYELDVPAPSMGWRSGRVLLFPGLGANTQLFVDRIEIDRGRSLPGVRASVVVLGASLLVAAALRSSHAGTIFSLLVAAALARDPALGIPFLPILFLGTVATFLLAGWSRGVIEVASKRGLLPDLSPAAVSIALAGFVAWFVAIASPLYVGGHYGFHTDIAEEIWQGQFLHYFLPYPGSMLSRQPQWDHLIVPHSCLFHTVVSPLAALPHEWFHLVTKLFLASLLFGIALGCALVATLVGGARTGMYAALASVLVPTGSQLLGLGHLMTLFGTWASTLALGFIVVQAEQLSRRRGLAVALALLVVCFLSYTGSLLFTSVVLAASCTFMLARKESPALAKRLVSALLVAWGLAFLLYYIHWTLPFVRDSLPALLGGSGSDPGIDVWARVVAQPRKLAYTFGSALLPLVGLSGLFLATGARRVILVSWGAILVVFMGVDVVFNFLLKHHYFTYPVVAVGFGLALGWLHEKNWLTRVIAALGVVYLLWMGIHAAASVANGVS
jgi:hypothetical protein